MATDFIMPRLPDQQQTSAFYNQSATFHSYNFPQISPLSTSNSNNTSPTSPKSHYTRQVRPLYMPAVLRPTEHPPKLPTARSRPGSGCLDDRPNSTYLGITGLGAFGRLRRRSTDDSRRSADDCNEGWKDLNIFPKVTGLPSRHHWKPDASSTICDEPTCKRHFNYFTRRHHCRRCGNIFCDLHSAHDIPLDQDLNFNPRAAPSRSCDHCYSQYNAWRSRTNSQASSTASSEANLAILASGSSLHHSNNGTASSSPIVTSPAAINTPVNPLTSPDAAASVPRDWNWSTF